MFRPFVTAATAAVVVVAASFAMAKGDEPKPSVHYAKTWEKAVEEAKTLVLPITVHSHGFY